VGLVAAIACAGVVVDRVTPASLVASPTRPYQGHGNSAVRMEQRAYPRSAIGADDVRMSIGASPRRIVSQYGSTDEFLYSVVPPERVVGVSEAAYLEGLSNVTDLVRRHRPVVALDPEQVLRARPDLVLTPADARSDIPALLREAGVPVYRIYTMFETLESIEAHIRLIGYLTGEDARADAEATRFHDTVVRAAARRPTGIRPPRVMGLNATYSYGRETLFTDILRVLGAENVAATNGFVSYDRVTDEHIVRWDPEWIVAGSDAEGIEETHARLLARPAIAATTAAKRGQIVVFDYRVFLPLSPFTARFVETLAATLYGGHSS
jgi:iron complex transport system substrate-binding protein